MASSWTSNAKTCPDSPTNSAKNTVSCPFPAVASTTESHGLTTTVNKSLAYGNILFKFNSKHRTFDKVFLDNFPF